ncbi:MAG: hypothetical protein GY913_13955 [Proteobacteria bacterium]|nr:hypothetical protein [Pseudomonadota bacterium]MCP4918012.1 hypothetical protein [Pseudomonadota bacterium]
MLLFLVSPSLAATINVPSDYSTIQSAVNNASNGDKIVVAAGTYEEDVDTKGKNLTIQGAGASTTEIDATGETHAIVVDSGETVTVSGFTLTGSDQGLEVRGSTVTASNIKVKDVTGESAGGGYLVADGGDLTISDCNVKNVSLGSNQYGGGFFVYESTLTASNCTVSGNEAYQGAGFYIFDSDVTLTDVTISSNSAEWHGGGMRIREGSTVAMTRVTIDGNVAGDDGGGIDARDSDIQCQNCVITDNTSPGAGGGVFLTGSESSSGSWFKGANAELDDNTSEGAALYAWDTKLEVRGTVSDNVSTATTVYGTGIFWGGGAKLTLQDVLVSGHTSTKGAVYISNGGNGEDLLVDSSTFEDNTSEEGGAIWSDALVEVNTSDFTNNSASTAGGAIYVEEAELEVYDSTFTANNADVQGGAVNVYKDAMTVKRSVFLTNTSATGGAVFHHAGDASGANGVLSKNTFDRNVATSSGGGVAADAPKQWTSSSNTYSDNSPEGAAITGANTLNINGDTYSDNAEEGLKATSCKNGTTQLTKFLGNGEGGAYYFDLSKHDIVVSTFVGNVGTGLTVSSSGADVEVANCDAVGNSEHGVNVEFGSGAAVLNTISAHNGSDGFRLYSTSGGTYTYSDAYGNGTDWGQGVSDLEGTDGNIAVDPEYTGWSDDGNASNDVLYLGSTSPCRDAGDPNLSDGDGSRSDMGSFGGPSASDEDDDGDGYKPSDGDCDNDDDSVYPGADDAWYDGVDSDCDGRDDYDKDGDGYREERGGDPASETDCDDSDSSVHPGADDPEGDGIDQDCDGVDGTGGNTGDSGDTDSDTDTGTSPTDTGIPGWWDDNDGDGMAPAQGDCDDTSPWVYRGAVEQCDDGVDNDCDGAGDATDADCQGSAACAGCSSTPAPALAGFAALLLGLALTRRRSLL